MVAGANDALAYCYLEALKEDCSLVVWFQEI